MASSVDDPEAFLLILDGHFERIAAYIARRSGTSQLEELTSEVFLRAFANRRRYNRARAEVLPWLYGIATNVLRESWREEQRDLELRVKIEAAAQEWRPADSTDEARALAPRVRNAVRALSEEEREPLLLFALADLDYAQIAAALGVPLGTIKSRISRAREQMRRQLDEAETELLRFAKEGVSDG